MKEIERIRLIAVDLDNTLMRSDKTVSDYTAGVLLRCREKGLRLAFATARSRAACARVEEQLRPGYTVSCGGALVCRGEAELARRVLPARDADSIIRFCRSLPSVGRILVEMADGRYLVSDEAQPGAVGDYAHGAHWDFEDPPGQDVLKLVIQLADEKDRDQVMERFSNLEVHNYTGSSWVFFAAPSATKWQGLLDVAADMGIGPAHIIAFGDDTGDIEMLQKSGVGVAMDNAVPAAKAAADETCPGCDGDGVARWLEGSIL